MSEQQTVACQCGCGSRLPVYDPTGLIERIGVFIADPDPDPDIAACIAWARTVAQAIANQPAMQTVEARRAAAHGMFAADDALGRQIAMTPDYLVGRTEGGMPLMRNAELAIALNELGMIGWFLWTDQLEGHQ